MSKITALRDVVLLELSKRAAKGDLSAKQLKEVKPLLEQGINTPNLIALGYLSPLNANDPAQVKRAATAYRKSLEMSPTARRREQIASGREAGLIDFLDEQLAPIVTRSPEELYGKVLIPNVGDTTATGRTVTKYGGFEPEIPIESHGGPDFPRQMQERGLPYGWASNRGAAANKQAQFDRIAEETKMEPVAVATAMGYDANFFAAPYADAFIQKAKALKIPAKDAKVFDKMVREGVGSLNKKTGKMQYSIKPFPEWVGINSPEARDQLLGLNGYPNIGGRRVTVMTAAANQKKFREMGFPVVEDIHRAMQMEGAENLQRGDAGYAMYKPEVGASVEPIDFHQSYDTGIRGQYLGQIEGVSVPPEVMFPDIMADYAARGKSRADAIGGFMMNPDLRQVADQKWLDNISKYLESGKQAGNVDPKLLALLAGGGLLGAGVLGAMAPQEAQAGVWGAPVREMAERVLKGDGLLFHSGTADQAESLAQSIDPQYGDWLQEIAMGSVDDPQNFLANMPEASWYADSPSWVKMKVAQKLKKPVGDVTRDDIEKYGQLSIVDPSTTWDEGAEFWRIPEQGTGEGERTIIENLLGEKMPMYQTPLYSYDDFTGQSNYVFGLEPNDIVTTESIEPIASYTGQDLLEFLDQINNNKTSFSQTGASNKNTLSIRPEAAITAGLLTAGALSSDRANAGLLSTGTKVARSVADETKRLIDMGYPESVAERIASGELDMSPDAVAKRKEAYPDQLYHGSMQDIQGEFTAGYGDGLLFFTPDPQFASNWVGKGKMQQRAGELDWHDRFKLQRQAVYDQLGSPEYGTPEYEEFERLTGPIREQEINAFKTIYPVRTRLLNTFDPTAEGAYENVTKPIFEKRFGGSIDPETERYLRQGSYMFYEDRDVVRELKKLGYDSMRLSEDSDGKLTTVAKFDPYDIKALGAAFDPEYVGPNILGNADPKLLALLAGGGLLGSFFMPKDVEASLLGVGSTIGKKAEDMLGMAMTMRNRGVDPAEIWQKTGWEFNERDGRWRTEHNNYDNTKVTMPEQAGVYPITDVVDDPDLLGAYDNDESANRVMDTYGLDTAMNRKLSSLKVEITPELKPNEAMLDGPLIRVGQGTSPEQFRATILHEMQHSIQENESFAVGGNEDLFRDRREAYASGDFGESRESVERKLNIIRDVIANPPQDVSFQQMSELYTMLDRGENKLRAMNAYERDSLQGQRSPYQMYQSMMGEVEARNIEERDQPRGLMREFMPESTEDPRFPRNEQIVMDRSLSPYLDENMDVVPYRQPLDINYPRQVTVGEAKTPEANYNLLDAAVPAAIAYDYGNGANFPVRPAQGLLAPEPEPKPEPMKLDTTMVPAGVPINPYTFMMSTGADQGEAARYVTDAYTNIARGTGNAIAGFGGEMETLGKGLMYALTGQGLGGSPWSRFMRVLNKYDPQLPNTQDVSQVPALLPNVSPMTEEERRMYQLAGEFLSPL